MARALNKSGPESNNFSNSHPSAPLGSEANDGKSKPGVFISTTKARWRLEMHRRSVAVLLRFLMIAKLIRSRFFPPREKKKKSSRRKSYLARKGKLLSRIHLETCQILFLADQLANKGEAWLPAGLPNREESGLSIQDIEATIRKEEEAEGRERVVCLANPSQDSVKLLKSKRCANN